MRLELAVRAAAVATVLVLGSARAGSSTNGNGIAPAESTSTATQNPADSTTTTTASPTELIPTTTESPPNLVPTTTQRVYLGTALGCSNVEGQSARFTPLAVSGPGYTTLVTPVEDCKELRITNSYVYDVPMPATGQVTITPGNQPAATLDAARVVSGRAATVYYGRVSEGQFQVTVIYYLKDEDVAAAL